VSWLGEGAPTGARREEEGRAARGGACAEEKETAARPQKSGELLAYPSALLLRRPKEKELLEAKRPRERGDPSKRRGERASRRAFNPDEKWPRRRTCKGGTAVGSFGSGRANSSEALICEKKPAKPNEEPRGAILLRTLSRPSEAAAKGKNKPRLFSREKERNKELVIRKQRSAGGSITRQEATRLAISGVRLEGLC